MSGTERPLWEIATSFADSLGPIKTAIMGRVTDKGLVPVAIIDGGSGSFGSFYANSENPIFTDPTSKELGTIGFTYSLDATAGDWQSDISSGNEADALVALTNGIKNVLSYSYVFNGATYDRVRGAIVYKTVVATAAGETTVWTPAAGKRVRLMGYTLSVAGTLAATGVETIQLLNGNAGTAFANHLATVTQTTPTGDTQMGADLGQGKLLTADANLRIKLGTAMSTGGVAINAWGIEE